MYITLLSEHYINTIYQINFIQSLSLYYILCYNLVMSLKHNLLFDYKKTAANILALCFLQMYLLLLHIISYSLNHLLAAIINAFMKT